ncbi:C-X-C motif chemokine 9-like isoform X1 [Boleophthalmus pectinirostris]|uniref:C-X-C motif chemokine 9-like isoform X1 n=1 Tax=Boleophthalmus pectinirostris TaxID=150288 RepID=UPI002432F66E|nr:C-X-C motif chemokine 9-like isoform X1 [Boleophthalmus pectinirostris]
MCAAMCASKPLEPRCRCAETDKSVKLNLILSYRKTAPTIFCNKTEVIVTLKDKRKVCIDPNGKFFHFLEELRKKLSQTRAKKNSAITTTEPPAEYSTASGKTLQTSSPLM